jgi:hypothetical protein
MTILSTKILPLTLMASVSPNTRGGAAASTARRAVPAHGIKLNVLTKGKQAAVITRASMGVLVGSVLACAPRPIIWNVKMLRECIV